MPTFLLIRHGENEYTRTGRLAGRLAGVHLNEKGRAQAQALANRLSSAPIRAVYSSPLERTLETAEPLARALNLEVVQRPALMETDLGEWQGQTLKSMARSKFWTQLQSTPSIVRFPGGESFVECQSRLCQELLDLAARHNPGEMVACVTHADPLKLAVAYFIGLPLDLFQRLSISTGSLTTLQIGEGPARLISLNVDTHFTFPLP